MVQPKLQRFLSVLDIEERILLLASSVALVSTFLPWISGDWLGERSFASGVQSFTSYMGYTIVILFLALIVLTLLPLFPAARRVSRRIREVIRLLVSLQASILTIASLSVLLNITFQQSRSEIRFGVYLTLIGSVIASIYSFLKWHAVRSRDERELFHHPDDHMRQEEHIDIAVSLPPPPPPPPPPPAEEHSLHTLSHG